MTAPHARIAAAPETSATVRLPAESPPTGETPQASGSAPPFEAAARFEGPGTAERPAIRTFHPRRGRMSARHADAHAALWPTFGFTVVDGDRTPLDLTRLFGRSAPVVLEIGFGMGDSTAAMAAAEPGTDFLGIEVHTPGIGNLLALINDNGLRNVRVARGDAMELAHRIAPGSLAGVHVFFPDPWPKARHHKRRLIRPGNVAVLRDRLRPGGILHCATDWPHYAAAMTETLDADPGLRRVGTDRSARPETKFERRGTAAGRPITDLRYARA